MYDPQGVLQAVQSSNYVANWAPVPSSIPGHTATFMIWNDALKVNGVRVAVSANLAQQIADFLGASMLTAKLADLLFAARGVTLPPHTQPPTSSMGSPAVIAAQSAWTDAQIPPGTDPTAIVQTVGKHWILDNLLAGAAKGKAINYGWHMLSPQFQGAAWGKSVTLPGVWTVQSRGWAHSAEEADYSQNCVLVSNNCVVDGSDMYLQDVLQDPTLSFLANHDGVLRVLRQPGAPSATIV